MSGEAPREVALGIVTAVENASLTSDTVMLWTTAIDPVSGVTFARAPGGGLEPGEDSSVAVTREFFEECGVHLRAGALLGVIEHRTAFATGLLHERLHVHRIEASRSAFNGLAATLDKGWPMQWASLNQLRGTGVHVVPAELERLFS